MRLLLDTHVFLWYVFKNEGLSSRAVLAIGDPENEVYVSLVSMWESAIKHSKGRLELNDAPDVFFASNILRNGFGYLPLRPSHVYTTAALPILNHKDPFDRALVAQAKVEALTLISADEKLDQYGVARLF